jgi:hypothetical protein
MSDHPKQKDQKPPGVVVGVLDRVMKNDMQLIQFYAGSHGVVAWDPVPYGSYGVARVLYIYGPRFTMSAHMVTSRSECPCLFIAKD